MDWTGAIASIPATAIGVFLGLFGSGLVSWRQDRNAFRAMLRSIASEARSNEVVLDRSFLALYATGMVLREFSTATVIQCVGNPLFVRHASSVTLDRIYEYLRAVSLANAYRGKAEAFQLDYHGKHIDDLLKRLVEQWGTNLAECGRAIATVIELDRQRTPQRHDHIDGASGGTTHMNTPTSGSHP